MAILHRAIAEDASAVAIAVDTTDIVAQIEQIHHTSAVTTAALGRLATAACMMGYELKNATDSITLRLDGHGPAGKLTAVADANGNIKADITNPIVEIPLNHVGKLDVAGAVGRDGTLSVVKDLGLKDPYVGVVPLVSGEIAEDIANYFATSEQTPTVCGLGVLVSPDLTVAYAGGYLIEVLPYAPEATIATLEKNLTTLRPVTQMLAESMTPDKIALHLLDGLNPNLLDNGSPTYVCDCSYERTKHILNSLPQNERAALIAENEPIEVICHFCGKKYTFSPEDLI